MLSKYIKELIADNSRIIIPDFGAFMIQDTPEGKIISFNDFLKFNDSVLLNKIIVSEKIDATQGKEAIKNYVKQIENTFKEGKEFFIDGVGRLSKNNNTIVFVQDGSAVSNNTPIATPQPIPQPVSQPKPQPTPTPEPPKEEPKPVTPKPKPTNATSNSGQMGVKTKGKNLNTIILIVAILVIVAAIVWAIINFKIIDRFKKAKQPQAIEQVEETAPVVADTIVNLDTIPEVAAEPEIVTSTEPEPTIVSEPTQSSTKRCYIIIGSFQVEANAQKLQQELINNGQQQAEVVTRNNGYFYVSLKSFATRVEAIEEWKILVADNPNVWILIK